MCVLKAHMCHCTDRLLWARATEAGWISTGFDHMVYREQRRAWQLVSAARRAADHMVDGTIMIGITQLWRLLYQCSVWLSIATNSCMRCTVLLLVDAEDSQRAVAVPGRRLTL